MSDIQITTNELAVLLLLWTFASAGLGFLLAWVIFGGSKAPAPISARNRRQLDALMARTAR